MTKQRASLRNESLTKHNLHQHEPETIKTMPIRRISTAHKMVSVMFGQMALVLLLVAAAGHLQAAILVQSQPSGQQQQQPSSGQPNLSDSSQISPATGHQSSVSSQETQQQQSASQMATGNDIITGQQHHQQAGPTMSNSIGLAAAAAINQQQQINQAQMGMSGSSLGVPSSALAGSMSPNKSPQPLVLPKINIYASRSEVKKLLGIDTSISYITSGKLEEYPLGFTIPMGYHLSDMIFTWQNLGPTNVNYSISLVIGNIQAVERPLINITRSGLIPRHEQVFKITLPCSGKITDEVDVQVLINIMGLVPVLANNQQQLDGDNIFGSAVDEANSSVGGEAQPSAADYQLARAIQQQNEFLAAAQQSSTASGGLTNSSAGDQMMQADQQLGDVPSKRAPTQQPQMRMVSHTIAIKRKKICTMHPVPVQPITRPIPEVRPPNQPPAINGVPSEHPTQSKWTTSTTAAPPTPDQQSTPSTNGYQPSAPNQQQLQPQTPVAEPAHQPAFSVTEASVLTVGQMTVPQARPNKQQPNVANDQATARRGGQQPGNNNNHINWPARTLQQQQPPQSTANQAVQVDVTNSLIELRQQTNAGQQQQTGAAAASNPLLFTLIIMSLIISVALIALLVLGSTSSSYSHSVGSSRRESPLDKLTALTNCIWRRTSAGSRAVNKCTKNVGPITIKNGIIGTFGCATNTATNLASGRTSSSNHHHHHHHGANDLKSNVSSMSGLSTISGLNSKHHHQNIGSLMSPYCQKQQQQHANYNTGYYHHYQQPPDLLIGATATTTTTANNFHHSSITSPYQITMSNNQMTKLFLANPTNSGTYSIDNNYMPIATTNTSSSSSNGFQAPHSDSGSVYQTIY